MKRNLYLDVQEKEEALENFLGALAHIRPEKQVVSVTESLGRGDGGGGIRPLFQSVL